MADTNLSISKIKLPDEENYREVRDDQARVDIETLKKYLATGVQYMGKTTTELKDGSTVTTISIDDVDIPVTSGLMVNYNGVLFAWNGDSWDRLGLEGPLGRLAFLNVLQILYTPEGRVAPPMFTGKEDEVIVSGVPTGIVTKPIFTGTESNINVKGTSTGVVSVSSGDAQNAEDSNYTPSGNITVKTISKTVSHVTDVGMLPSLEVNQVGEKLSLSFNPGALPTKEDASVTESIDSASFVGNPTKITADFKGTEFESTGKFTPEGENSIPEFVGSEIPLTGTFTPSGYNSEPKFIGKEKAITIGE